MIAGFSCFRLEPELASGINDVIEPCLPLGPASVYQLDGKPLTENMSIMAPTLLSLVDRLPDALGDDRRILVQSEQHRPLEALWASNDHPHSATKWISSNPALEWLFDVLATGLHGRFDPFSPGSGDSLAVEDQQRHLDIVHLLGLF